MIGIIEELASAPLLRMRFVMLRRHCKSKQDVVLKTNCFALFTCDSSQIRTPLLTMTSFPFAVRQARFGRGATVARPGCTRDSEQQR